jgi:hypothetical protein
VRLRDTQQDKTAAPLCGRSAAASGDLRSTTIRAHSRNLELETNVLHDLYVSDLMGPVLEFASVQHPYVVSFPTGIAKEVTSDENHFER